MKVIFFSLLLSRPAFLSRPESHLNNSSRRGYTVDTLSLSDYFMKHNLMYISLYLI